MMSYVNHVTVIVVEKLFNTSCSINIRNMLHQSCIKYSTSKYQYQYKYQYLVNSQH